MVSPLRINIRRRPLSKRNNTLIGLIIVAGFLVLIFQAQWMQKNLREIQQASPLATSDPEFFKKLAAKIIHLYECEHCQGSGLIPDPERIGERVMCEVCYGVGYRATRRFGESERMCIACGGMGRIRRPDARVDDCDRCAGRGIVRFEPDPKIRSSTEE